MDNLNENAKPWPYLKINLACKNFYIEALQWFLKHLFLQLCLKEHIFQNLEIDVDINL